MQPEVVDPVDRPQWLASGDFTEANEPFQLFAAWFEDATRAEPADPNAMALATVDADGMPNARMVLLKEAGERGFVFFTHASSVKGCELRVCPRAALVFHWKSLKRQVRVRGAVEAASAAFRERGVAETGVDEVMRRAGLTHGGFYAHFRDKNELVAEACAAAFDAAVPNLDRIAARPTAAERARLLIDSYLSGGHRDNRGTGCVVVAVGADAARLSGAARTGYARGLVLHIDRLCAALRLRVDPAENRDRVTQLMSSLVGALLFARATEEGERSDATLRAMRRLLRAEFCGEAKRKRMVPAGPLPAQAAVDAEDELALHLR